MLVSKKIKIASGQEISSVVPVLITMVEMTALMYDATKKKLFPGFNKSTIFLGFLAEHSNHACFDFCPIYSTSIFA